MICSVKNCQNSPKNGYSMFGFPLDRHDKLLQWKESMNYPNWKINRKSKICEAHFLDQDFYLKLELRPEAVPTLCNSDNFKSKLHMYETIDNLRSELQECKSSLYKNQLKIKELLLDENLKLRQELNICKQHHNNFYLNIKGTFNENQIKNLDVKYKNRKRWDNATIEKALKIKFVCGTSGYQYLLKQNFPLPSTRTLSRKIEHIPFLPGILHEIFNYLSIKIKNFNEFERDCCLFLDEAAMIPGKEYCIASSTTFGNETISNSGEIATHVLIFMLGGITLRWKQIICYHFTGDSVSGASIAEIVKEIIVISDNLGLNVVNVTSDMGPSNQAMWKCLGIKAKKIVLQNSIVNPKDSSKNVYFMADPPHLFKNIRSALINNEIIEIPNYFVEKYTLPTNIVDIKKLANFQENMEFQLAPKLTAELFHLNHFNKMKVSKAYYTLNQNVRAGLIFLFGEVDDSDKNAVTTAWFVGSMYNWFCILTSRSESLALSKFNKTEYQKTIEFLREVIFLFKYIKIGQHSRWKPIQTGIILTTQSILDIQEYLLTYRKYKYICTSRFSQDVLENIIGQMRLKQSSPNAIQCRQILKNLSIVQFLEINAYEGSYTIDNSPNLIDSNTLLKTSCKQNEKTNMDLLLPDGWNSNNATLNEIQLNCLYNSAGYILKRIRQHVRCQICLNFMFSKRIDKPFTKLVRLKEFRPGSLNYASESIFQIFIKMEQIFLNLSKHIPNKNFDFLKCYKFHVFNDDSINKTSIPQCHTIRSKIINTFCLYRIRIYLAKLKRNTRNMTHKSSGYYKGSKSVESNVLYFN